MILGLDLKENFTLSLDEVFKLISQIQSSKIYILDQHPVMSKYQKAQRRKVLKETGQLKVKKNKMATRAGQLADSKEEEQTSALFNIGLFAQTGRRHAAQLPGSDAVVGSAAQAP
jgi:hypothetical protein